MVTIHKNKEHMTVTRGVYLQQYQKWGWKLEEPEFDEELESDQEPAFDYNKMTVTELREQAATAGCENATGLKKAELIALLTNE